jgi:hypothetical protein
MTPQRSQLATGQGMGAGGAVLEAPNVQAGRFGKIYQQPKPLPRRLRAVVMQLELRVPARRGRHWAKGNDKD